MLTLISATPSPYARKVRIQLAEKAIPFTLQTEVPWDSTTATPEYNPLEKLPVLILDDGTAVYESHHILEWVEIKHPQPPLLPPVDRVDDRLFVKQVEVVTDGVCDALVLALFEKMRDEDKQSAPWLARQMRKVDGGLNAIAKWVDSKQGEYVTPGGFGLADIAIGSVLGYMSVRWPNLTWKQDYPGLDKYWQMLESRDSFKDTVPTPQMMKDKIV